MWAKVGQQRPEGGRGRPYCLQWPPLGQRQKLEECDYGCGQQLQRRTPRMMAEERHVEACTMSSEKECPMSALVDHSDAGCWELQTQGEVPADQSK